LWHKYFFGSLKCTKCATRASACTYTSAAKHHICAVDAPTATSIHATRTTSTHSNTGIYTTTTTSEAGNTSIYTATTTSEARDACIYATTSAAKASTTGIYTTYAPETRAATDSTGVLCPVATHAGRTQYTNDL
jgi:hypothetical protein